jgi:uroporphyrin-III C-methyltransferase/precorrin-2 dehydrogenase/sirohydrochlorin ferrochelatase
VFAQAIRVRIETLIPQGFARWAALATQWRARVQALAPSRRARLWFWEKFAARALAHPDATPGETDLDAVLASGHGATPGSVVLVGAGPGDPELLTLRAVRALQSADVILFDQNIPAGILDFARREARKLLVRPSGSGDAVASKQTEIEAMMIALAKAGRRVVRLTRGDPINATGIEAEIAACSAASIAVEVVPGIAAPDPSPGSQPYFPSSLPAAFHCDIRPATVPSSGLVALHTRLQSGH